MQYLMHLAVSLEKMFLVSHHRFSAMMKYTEDIYLYKQYPGQERKQTADRINQN